MEEQNKQTERDAELDEFWEIDALLPKRKTPPPRRDIDPVDLELDPPTRKDGEEVVIRQTESLKIPQEPRFIPPHYAGEYENRPKPAFSYSPDSLFLRRVDLYSKGSTYRCYEDFLKTAKQLREVKAKPCAPVPFISYVPQYAELNSAQKNWYLWWRERLWQGEALQTDYSYVLLYLYELVNLSDTLPPEDIQKELLSVWIFYRKVFPQLTEYLAEWICDHALIHQIKSPDCPMEERSELMRHCVLKEFYLSQGNDDGALARCLLSFAASYDYRKSKFYTKETAALFDATMQKVMEIVIDPNGSTRDLLKFSTGEEGKIARDAYAGAICSYGIRKRIEVSYSSFFHAHETRFLINDVIKYTENHLRAHLEIRSRLSLYALPTALREVIDRYFEQYLPPRKAEPKQTSSEPPAYEKLYDLPQKEFSLAEAAEIEKRSWDTTKRLVEAFEEELEPSEEPTIEIPASAETEPEETDGFAKYLPFLRAIYSGDALAQKDAARALGKLPDVAVDEINALAADLYGDILLTEGENGRYEVIEDYRPVLEELLKEGDTK